jgi:excisionase family DNA binding protein
LNRKVTTSHGCPQYQRFLSPEQAAEYLGGLNSRTVTRWAREGYLPSYPIGEGKRRLWRFQETDLTQWMLSRRTGQISFDPEPYAATLSVATDAPTRRYLEG